MPCFVGQNPIHSFPSLSKISPLPKPKPCQTLRIQASFSIPARDRVIDFGKYKGKMLGTLPSTYLKWVSNNLKARDFVEWANLANQVLQDPIYKDRLEWEFAQKLLNGDNALASSSMSQGAVSELLELSQRFGWDNEDKIGWRKVDFELLGTSKGGRIPRVKEGELKSVGDGELGKRRVEGGVEMGKRGERRERVRMRMKRGVSISKMNVGVSEGKCEMGSSDQNENENGEIYNPFPGRESLLRKALTRRNMS